MLRFVLVTITLLALAADADAGCRRGRRFHLLGHWRGGGGACHAAAVGHCR